MNPSSQVSLVNLQIKQINQLHDEQLVELAVNAIGLAEIKTNDQQAQELVEYDLRERTRYIVAKNPDTGEIVGVAAWKPTGEFSSGCAQIIHFGVSKKLHGQGYGRQLFNELKKVIFAEYFENDTEIRKIWTLVGSHRYAKSQFLEHIGMEREGTMSRHLSPRRNEIMYSIFLK